jgi:hypothetical protein
VTLELDLDAGRASNQRRPRRSSRLLNLTSNAREAMPEGGRLAIEATIVTVDDEACSPAERRASAGRERAGRGTTFRLLFRAVDPPAEEPLVVAPPLPDLDGSQTVLIVVDGDVVRGLVQEIPSGHRHTVLAAGTPEEALEIASRWKEPLHLVLSDVMLPARPGRAAVSRQAVHGHRARLEVREVLAA